jgi:hypothetical protein
MKEPKPTFIAQRFRDLPAGAVHIYFDEQHCCERLAWKTIEGKHKACFFDFRKAKIEWLDRDTESINEMVLAEVYEERGRKAEERS